jgi:hypothetical protein
VVIGKFIMRPSLGVFLLCAMKWLGNVKNKF